MRYVERSRAFRIAARGRSIYIFLPSMGSVAEWALVLLVTIAAFRVGVEYAYLERGYHAHGGEYLLLLIPALYYAAKRTIVDWIAVLRELR